ncbi:hypothetical protein HYW75_02700 [Candidatus Pacearchaeota archaeon]|nr:hypothetical protein [Candidatus Pacearchaeota archaeon]
MKKTSVFIYDELSDRLFISNKKENDEIYGSVRLLSLTLDFTTDMRVVNIELREASRFLESLNINSNILNNLSDAEFIIQQQQDGYLIYFILKAGAQVERIPYNIITEKNLSIISA